MSFFMTMIAGSMFAASPAQLESVIDAADAFDRAQLDQDRAAMEWMVLDDLVFVDGSGRRLGKKELIDGWMGPDDKYDPVLPTDRVVTPLGPDAAVVNAAVEICRTSAGARSCKRIRFADTFVRVGGQWRVAHIQVTRIAGE